MEYRERSEFPIHFFVEFLKTTWSSQLDVLFFDLAHPTRESYRSLSLNYKNKSKTFVVNVERDMANVQRVFKTHFEINNDTPIDFRLTGTEPIIDVMRTEDFWLLSTDAVPEYDIMDGGKKGEFLRNFLHHINKSRALVAFDLLEPPTLIQKTFDSIQHPLEDLMSL